MKKPFANILISIMALLLATLACDFSMAASPQGTASISGKITADLNGNGTTDEGENPLDNVIVSLSGCGENKTALSGADGSFQFSGLPTGVCVLDVSKGGWTYSASYPIPEYPIPVTTSEGQSAALVIYMRPADQTQPTPASNEPTATLAPTLTMVPTDIPFTATPTIPMVAAIDKGVNCRFGPGTKYAATDALLVGSPVPILGRTEDSSWWQINNPSGGAGDASWRPASRRPPVIWLESRLWGLRMSQ